MNLPIVKFTVQTLLKQPIVAVVFLIELVIVAIIFSAGITLNENQIVEINIWGFTFDEPFLIKEIASNTLNMLCFIISFLAILISTRFFYEFINDSILEIILPKLQNKKDLLLSSFWGLSLFLIISLSSLLVITIVFFAIKYNLFLYTKLSIAALYLLLSVFYIVSLSALVTQLFDGFTASIILIIPLLFGKMFINMLGDEKIISKIFTALFPLSYLNGEAIQASLGDFSFSVLPIPIFLLNLLFIWLAITIFARKRQ